jgi:putative ABC transport system permease protein
MLFTLIESLRTAWMGIAGNKLRTVLTMLGVIIGVAAVIALVSVGQGAQVQATKQITALGSNLVTVGVRGNGYRIETKDLDALMQRVPGIAYTLPTVSSGQVNVKADGDNYQVTVEGTGESYPQVRERNVINGSWFAAQDVANRQRVAVLGTTTVTALFGPGANPLGRTVRILGQTFTVIGVAEPKGTGFGGQDQDDMIFVPYTTLQRLMGLNRIPSLVLKTRSSDDSAAVTQQVTDYFVEKFRNQDAVRVQSQDQLLETVSSMTQVFTMLLAAIELSPGSDCRTRFTREVTCLAHSRM